VRAKETIFRTVNAGALAALPTDRPAPAVSVGVPANPARRPLAVAVVAGVALLAAACANPMSSPRTTKPPSSSTAPAGISSTGSPGSAYSWLSFRAVPANKVLNAAQNGVVVASRPTPGESSGSFFAALRSTCTKLQAAVAHGRKLPVAPSKQLDSAWRSMLDATSTYSDHCITLARSHSSADLAAWDTSLKAMNSANAALNAIVSTIREAGPSGA